MLITNKIALITGGASGIGKATSIELAKKGASVIINYLDNTNEAKNILKTCNKYSKNNQILRADISRDEDVNLMFQKIKADYKTLDILINSAGIRDEADSPTNISTFERTFNVNFLGHVRVITEALKIMKTGKIINISSIHGRLGQGRPGAAAYAAMKAALENYTKNLVKQTAPNIIVNAIAPGRTLTPLWGSLSKKREKEISENQLIKRFIKPEEIANGIIFLLENDAVCGEVLTIDGGMSLI
jgi:3-oxoacyl-[acyl-carrier protein] reductase